ncbi:MAG: histidine kinase N-terminal 7TM domain-containing protein [Haloferacaceae archaeon]
MSTLLAMQAVLVVTIGVAVSGGLLAWRERPEPGAVPLTAFLAGACWWSATLFFRINATTVGAKVFWVDVSWAGVTAIPVAWLFFCLSYTGYSDYLEPRYVAAASVVPVLTVALGLTNEFHHLVYTGSVLVEHGGNRVLARTPGVWFWVAAGYTYLLGVLGAVPLLQFVSSDVETFRGQSLALLVGLVIPWVTNVLYLLGALPTSGIDPTPVAFSVSAVAFLGALTRFQLLDTSPAPIRPARRRVFDRMEAGVVVLDRRNNVVDMNDRAAAAMGVESNAPLGRDVGVVSARFDALFDDQSRSGTTTFRPEDGTGTYDVSVAELTDTHDRTVGHIVTLHDISDYLRQQQRLEVLNRVFRHNIRTNSQVLMGHVEYLADHDSDDRAEAARDKVMAITEFGDKIRDVLDVFERGRTETKPARLDHLVEETVAAVRAEYPDVTVHGVDCPPGVHVDSLAYDVLSNVVENAAQHNTNPRPEVWVDVERDGDSVRVAVRDNGPGINDEELALLTEGSETPLNHGSGLGLALIVWGTEIIGGRVAVEDREPAGTELTVELPVLRSANRA